MSKYKTIKKQNPVQTIFPRYMFIVALFVIWIGIIGIRLVHLQVNQSDLYRNQALSQRRIKVESKMLRGFIFDRTGRVLAGSKKVRSLYADPRYIDDVASFSQRIAANLKVKQEDIANIILEAQEKQKVRIAVALKLEEDIAQKVSEAIKDFEIKKIGNRSFKAFSWKEEHKRTYPEKSLAAQVIGFSDANDEGKAGIELSQEKNLRGEVISKWKDRDNRGRVYEESDSESEIEEREPPKDVVLTINSSIQYKVEDALKKGVEASKAKSGMAIVLDPKTGEILAMANYPTFDLNKFNEVSLDLHTNKTVQHSYALGSVFKLVTYSGALEEKVISPNGEVDCSKGVLIVAKRTFNDKHCLNNITYSDAFSVSSNIGAIRTAQKTGREKFYNYIRQFGFGETTGVELPAETRGKVHSPENWNADSLASMAIGYEIGVTALQSAVAFATIANDGIRVKPHIIKETRQADGKIVSTTESEKIQVISRETALTLRQMLQKVVLSGTGKRAQINGYTTAGKTGTAWKYDEKSKKVSGSKYISSFIGMAPLNNPSVVIAVILDDPQGAFRDGGQVSAPIFREIAEQILPELNVPPDGFISQEIKNEIIEEKELSVTENNKTQENTKDKSVKESSETKTKNTKDGKAVGNETKTVTKPKDVPPEPKPKVETKNKQTVTGKGKT